MKQTDRRKDGLKHCLMTPPPNVWGHNNELVRITVKGRSHIRCAARCCTLLRFASENTRSNLAQRKCERCIRRGACLWGVRVRWRRGRWGQWAGAAAAGTWGCAGSAWWGTTRASLSAVGWGCASAGTPAAQCSSLQPPPASQSINSRCRIEVGAAAIGPFKK